MAATGELFVNCEQFEKAVENELESYERLSRFIENKMKENAIDDMIHEYFNYINNINSDIKPNNSIKLIWKMHLLHPKIYRKDCFTRFGRMIIPPTLQLKFDTHDSDTFKPKKPSKFTTLDLKKSLHLHYEFLQKILSIKKDNINIKQWISNYKQFMSLIGTSNNKHIIKPTPSTDLIWHTHMLYPNIYFKECMLLSNGKFVKHIIDLKQIKKENIKNENIKTYNSLPIICISLILTIIISFISYKYIQSVPKMKIFATKTPSDVSCTTTDDMLCAYINGLYTIFTISDTLRDTLNQTDFDSVLDDIITNDIDAKTIFYNSDTHTLFTNSANTIPFNDPFILSTLIDYYGTEICEQTDVLYPIGPIRTNRGGCRGWTYIPSIITDLSKTKPPISVINQNTGYAILFGSIIDFDEDTLYYLYIHQLSYQDYKMLCSSSSECNVINTQMILGNALFFVSILGYDYSDTEIWSEMNEGIYNYYFDLTVFGYEYYVFVNRYSDGYRYVHSETSKRDTKTSLNSELRVAADNLYGEWIEYVRSNGQHKRSYIISTYPDNIISGRLYVGSGYIIKSDGDGGNNDSGSDNNFPVGYVVLIVFGVVGVMVCCWCYGNFSKGSNRGSGGGIFGISMTSYGGGG
eukprot:530042_1